MNPGPALGFITLLLLLLLAGFAVGALYFEALRRTVNRFVATDGWLGPVALTVGRIGMAAGAFTMAARVGATAVLVTFLGFLLARTVALHRTRRAW